MVFIRLNPNIRSVPKSYRYRILKKQNSKCALKNCKRNYYLGINDCETDHIIPWGEGVRSTENNLRVLCRTCHNKETENYRKQRWSTKLFGCDLKAIETLYKFNKKQLRLKLIK